MGMTDKEIRAQRAQELLESPEFKQAFNAVRESLVQGIEQCPFNDERQRDLLMLGLQLLPQIQQQFEKVIQEGLLEAWTIQRLNI